MPIKINKSSLMLYFFVLDKTKIPKPKPIPSRESFLKKKMKRLSAKKFFILEVVMNFLIKLNLLTQI